MATENECGNEDPAVFMKFPFQLRKKDTMREDTTSRTSLLIAHILITLTINLRVVIGRAHRQRLSQDVSNKNIPQNSL